MIDPSETAVENMPETNAQLDAMAMFFDRIKPQLDRLTYEQALVYLASFIQQMQDDLNWQGYKVNVLFEIWK